MAEADDLDGAKAAMPAYLLRRPKSRLPGWVAFWEQISSVLREQYLIIHNFTNIFTNIFCGQFIARYVICIYISYEVTPLLYCVIKEANCVV